MRRGLDDADQRPLGQIGRRDVHPCLAVVLGEMDEAIVRARPEDARFVRRFDEREDRAVDLRARVVPRDRAAGGLQAAGVVARQVGADRLPGRAEIGGAEDAVAGDVERVRVMAREENREGPLEAVLQIHRAERPAVEFGPDGDIAPLPGAMVVEVHPVIEGARADRAGGDDQIGVVVLDADVAALAAARLEPVPLVDRPLDGHARHGDRGVVLLRAVDAVGEAVVRRDVVELRGRLIVERGPRRAAGVGDARAAVIALNHDLRVVRVDPEGVLVAVLRGVLREVFAAVGGLPDGVIEPPDGLRVLRIGDQVAVVPGAGAQEGRVADPLPVSRRHRRCGRGRPPPPRQSPRRARPSRRRRGRSCRARPSAGRGYAVSSVQVSPPSVVFQRPESSPPLISWCG